MIEKTDKRDEFLLKIGRRVYRPNEVEIGNTLGIAYPDSEEIKIKYTDYIQLKPDFTPAYYLLAQVYESQGEKDAALQGYQMILKLNPGDKDIIERIESLR